MAQTLVRQPPTHSSSRAVDSTDFVSRITPRADTSAAAREAQLLEERKVNPLWMITVALAVLFGLGAMVMF